ncbi:hypothetical protein [Nitrosomonas sp.]|uniref:hypothetical protein n=1 Tax=Nitrosomonas sp. TaxID=42353 RepID=UPI00262EDAA3|nr:hypothetical protein [Nitrosomonas sp.]MCW5602596.1 hypothetical protein [Nitrosomonas sp.]
MRLIASHNFYVEQAQKRLLSQFQNMEAESHKYGEEWLNSRSYYFDPDRHDPASFYEQAYDESIGFYQMLEDMLNRTRLSVVAGIFHEWDKQLRSWIIAEINHWHNGDEIKRAIWKVNFEQIIDFLESIEFPVRSQKYYIPLNKCRLVVNAYKHGDGCAFESIKSLYPEFINTFGNTHHAIHTDLKVDSSHITEFSDAIIEFWKNVPEYVYEKNSLNIPDWFAKAYVKDQSDKPR